MRQFRTFTAIESYPGGGHDRVEVIAGDGGCVLAIADGMGGRSGAALAAEGWIAAVRVAAEQRQRWTDPDYWLDVMRRADRAIDAHPSAGETTAVVMAVTDAGLCGASVGDSGAWMIGDDSFIDLTRGQVRKPGLGTGMAVVVPFRMKRLEGTLLLGTDGLFKYASIERICQCVRAHEPESLPGELINLVRMPRGGLQDDVAVAVCRGS